MKAREIAEKLDQKTKERQAALYNRSRDEAPKFEEGSLVWIWREPPPSTALDPTRRTRKLEFKTSGAWRVVNRLSHITYRLRNTKTGKEDTFNVDTMCPVRVTDFTDPDDLIAEDVIDGEDGETARDIESDGPPASDVTSPTDPDDTDYDDSDMAPRIPSLKGGGECNTGARVLRPTPARRARAEATSLQSRANRAPVVIQSAD